jgi:hypothetical protein
MCEVMSLTSCTRLWASLPKVLRFPEKIQLTNKPSPLALRNAGGNRVRVGRSLKTGPTRGLHSTRFHCGIQVGIKSSLFQHTKTNNYKLASSHLFTGCWAVNCRRAASMSVFDRSRLCKTEHRRLRPDKQATGTPRPRQQLDDQVIYDNRRKLSPRPSFNPPYVCLSQTTRDINSEGYP